MLLSSQKSLKLWKQMVHSESAASGIEGRSGEQAVVHNLVVSVSRFLEGCISRVF